MQNIVINGPCKLSGDISIQGAKNSVLPILAATILVNGECIIHNCPNIIDVQTSLEILNYLGCKTKFEGSTITVDSRDISKNKIPENLMRKMRSSIIFLGALLARTKSANVTFPGGCEIGPRPIDLHLSSLQQLGVSIENVHGNLECKVNKKIKGTEIILPFPSVGATENILLAASICEGVTSIENAAREPEILDLISFLNKIGSKIYYSENSNIIIEGRKKFHPAEHTIIPDRIVAITMLAGVAITGSNAVIKNIDYRLISSSIPIFEEAGCKITAHENEIKIQSPEFLNSVKEIKTMPYPGFPTDAQAPIMAMLSRSRGTSVFIETIFENRFRHIEELSRLGAKIKSNGNVAIVTGVNDLFGAKVEAYDLRGAASIVVASLSAHGKTTISGAELFLRGYDISKLPDLIQFQIENSTQ